MQHFNKSIAAICLAAASTFAQAQQATYEFDISAQPASQVLDALAKQTGLQPFFAEDAVKGKPSPGVKGKYNLREALDKALAGTGLTYQFTGEKAVAIKAAEKAIARTLNKIDEIQLQEVVVTATKSELSVSDSPAAVTVITKKAISDRNVSRITDALGVTPSLFMGGAMDGQMNGGTGVSSITLRGMDTSRIGVLVDGQSLMDSYTNKIDFRTIFTVRWLGLSEQQSPKDKWMPGGWVKVQSYPRLPASALWLAGWRGWLTRGAPRVSFYAASASFGSRLR